MRDKWAEIRTGLLVVDEFEVSSLFAGGSSQNLNGPLTNPVAHHHLPPDEEGKYEQEYCSGSNDESDERSLSRNPLGCGRLISQYSHSLGKPLGSIEAEQRPHNEDGEASL